ncbi:aspartate carbamoyltransferase [Caballeronia sp. HLA56]|uniref:aspartate carbamoyltransferase n=2 Tax=unclassified Caballeronia TaxID=2646786 RepID=UPI00285B430B|nr:aspartate carbamoyltransferase [Caballeronia sp. LZ001]MDR5800725.1 aspartate carbamoyltransferase [Caballeronia sp. LZ001]
MSQQQTVLRDAMRRLNMTRDAFAARIGVSRRALDTWLLPDESPESRAMPEIAARYVGEILDGMPEGGTSTQSVYPSIAYEGRPQLVSIDQFSRESAEALFRTADMMQPIARRRKITRVLEGAVLANLFFEASTRTRVSFGSAFCRLGGSVVDTTGFTFSSMAKGESIYDTSRVISGYADAIVVRHPEQGSVAEFARATNIPVINAGDGPGEHPSQALLDLYTIQREFSRLGKIVDGAHIAMVGDLKYGRTVHSLAKLLSLYKGLKFTLISPGSLEMPAHIIERIARGDHVIEQTSDLRAGLAGADVVYATRIQKERFADESIEGYTPDFQINQALVNEACGRDTLIMHPLPRDSRPGANDLATDLNHDPRLAIFRQTDNGIAVRMAIFAVLLGVEHQVRHSMRDATWKSPASIGPDDAVFQGFD